VGRVACVAEDILMRLTSGSIALPTCYVDRHTDIGRSGGLLRADKRRNDAARCCARADRVRSGGPMPTAPERVGVATACLPGLRLSGDMP
jgi:hypothetical protein